MGTRLTRHLAGLAIPIDADRLLDDLAVNDGSATGSSYTQAGSRPGVSVPEDSTSRLVPVISGALGQDVEIVTLRSGTPALADIACEVGYRLADGADLTTRGWTAPNWVSGAWHALVLGATPQAGGDIVTCPGSQKVVACLVYSSRVYVRTYDPGADPETAWTAAVQVYDGTTGGLDAPESACLVALPSGRLLLLVGISSIRSKAYRSDDDGATWSLHSEHPWEPQTVSRARMAHANGSICLVSDGYQHASSDDLGSLDKIVDNTSVGSDVSIVAHPSGSFVMGYVRTADSYPCVRILPTAYSAYTDATAIVIEEDAVADMTLCADPDGLIWAYVTDAATPGLVRVHYSLDGGQTWTAMLYEALDICTTNADYVHRLAATHAAGATYLLCDPVGSTSTADATMCVRLGGWETVTTRPGYSWAHLYRRLGSGTVASYLGFERPDNTGKWTRNATGAPAESNVADGWFISTATGGTDTVTYAQTFSDYYVTTEAGLRLDSGGSATADEVYIQQRVADGTNDFKLKVRFYTSGGNTWINTRDPNAGGSADKGNDDTGVATGNMVRARLHIELDPNSVTAATGYVWVTGANDPVWTLAWTGSLTNDTGSPSANGQIIFGHGSTPASTTAESSWSYVSAGTTGTTGNIGAGIAGVSTYGAAGRPIGSLPVPLHPELEDSDGNVPWLSIASGPGALGEVCAVDRDYDFPVENILPTVSPSPDERWRSTSTAAQTIAWDAGDETWIGDSVALVAAGTNFRTADLDYHNGAAWVTAGSLDLATGFTGLDYSLSGDALIPGNSTTSGSRYVHEGELKGGYVVLETGGGAGTAAFRIRWNTAGSWVSSGTGTPRVRILLDGDLSSVDATGQCDVVWPGGVLVVHAAAILRARRWRVVIDGSQVVPDAYYTAGCLVPMSIRAFGRAPDWGWSRSVDPQSETRTSRYGTTRTRKLGPPAEVWSMAWTSGTTLYDLRNTASPDYVGSSVGLPLTAAEDVGWLLQGILDLSDSGAVPVVSLAAIPDASGTTVTDPSLWMLGRLESSVRMEHVQGDEGEGEVYRISQIDVRRLR